MIYLLNCRRFSALLGALAMLVVVQVLQLSGAPLNEMTPSKAAQELTAKGRVTFRVNGQPRVLILAPGEVAIARRGADAAPLPDGAQLAAADEQHRIVRLPNGTAPAQLLEVNRVRAQSGGSGGSASPSAEDIAPVFYEEGREGESAARKVATGKLLLIGADAVAAADAAAITKARGHNPLSDTLWVLDYASPYLMLAAAQTLESAGRSVEPQFTRSRVKRAAPNDPLYGQQLYFKNTGQGGGTAGEDLNIEGLWPSANGTGVTVAVVDDGLELTHPDLAPNIAEAALHRDVLNGTADPTPPADSNHGTICAGFIAARGNNGIGLTGAAPLAKLIGIRLLGTGANGSSATDVQEAEAFGWRTDVIQISSNSWGPNDDAKTVSGPDTAALAALKAGVTSGRGGRGVLYFVAAGNGRDSGDHAGWDGYSGSRYVFAIGATDNRGRQGWFSESGPQLIAAAIGSTTAGAEVQLLAADNVGARGKNKAESPEGDYTTNGVEGTSYAAPQASGVAALLLQANPNLGWRDVKEIFIRTARKNDATDSDWINNGAGFHFNHKYGAGFVDATAALNLAHTWTPLSAERSIASGGAIDMEIPDNATAGVSKALTVAPASPLRVETVEVTVSVKHPNRGQLQFEVTSPSGTRTVLGSPRAADTGADLTDWTFSTPRHWGENAAGTWTVRAVDTVAGATGSLKLAKVVVYGSDAVSTTTVITTITPDPIQPGAPITILGTNLPASGTVSVKIGSVDLTGATLNAPPMGITANVPPSVPIGSQLMTLTLPGGVVLTQTVNVGTGSGTMPQY
ncbi:MAG: S8 family peptidase, partial [Opitutaceae bacterium]